MPGVRQVTLAWSAVSYASSYSAKRSSTGAAGSYSTIATTTGTSYLDTGLADGTTYFYVVSASNSCGSSGDSSSSGGTTAPPAPTGFYGVGSSSYTTLYWNSTPGAYAYQIKRANVSGGSYTTSGAIFAQSYTDSPLAEGTSYFYKVYAQSVSGAAGPDSSELSVSTIPPVPTGVTVSATAGAGKLVVN